MKRLAAAVGALSLASAVCAAPELSSQDKRMLGGCSSLGAAITKSAASFPPEWRQLGTRYLFLPAVIEPPLKADPDFRAGAQEIDRSLAGQVPSAGTAAFAKSYKDCLAWVEPFLDKH